jgi:hypothetical protein
MSLVIIGFKHVTSAPLSLIEVYAKSALKFPENMKTRTIVNHHYISRLHILLSALLKSINDI